VSQVPFIDATGAHALLGFVTKARQKGVSVILAGASAHLKDELSRYGIDAKNVTFAPSAERAMKGLNGGPKSAAEAS
jgi:anti-anti-sigma regulatory factor